MGSVTSLDSVSPDYQFENNNDVTWVGVNDVTEKY